MIRRDRGWWCPNSASLGDERLVSQKRGQKKEPRGGHVAELLHRSMAEVGRSHRAAVRNLIAILGGNCSDIDHNLRTVTHPCYKARVCDTDLFSAFVTVDRAQEEVGAPKCPDSRELCAEAGDGTDERRIAGAFEPPLSKGVDTPRPSLAVFQLRQPEAFAAWRRVSAPIGRASEAGDPAYGFRAASVAVNLATTRAELCRGSTTSGGIQF